MEATIHIGEVIKNELETKNRSVAWLAGKVACDASNLRKKLEKPDISTDLLAKISEAMNVNFFAPYYEQFK